MAAELEGRIALVTGAAGGIGRATAIMLSQMGADLLLLDLKKDGLNATADAIRKAGRRCEVLACDIRDRDVVRASVAASEDTMGRIDVLVNNAGVGAEGPVDLESITDSDFDRMFGVHVMGCFVVTQAVVPGMKERQFGRIVNIASNRGQVGFTDGSHYSGAKGAMISLAKSWAKELAPWGILVNSVAPGVVRTPMTEFHGMDAIVEEAGWNLMNRWAEPEEIAASVAFLVSGAGSYYTGQVLCPNGGDPIVGI